MLVRMPIRHLSKQYRKKRRGRISIIIWADRTLINKKDNCYNRIKLLSVYVYL